MMLIEIILVLNWVGNGTLLKQIQKINEKFEGRKEIQVNEKNTDPGFPTRSRIEHFINWLKLE